MTDTDIPALVERMKRDAARVDVQYNHCLEVHSPSLLSVIADWEKRGKERDEAQLRLTKYESRISTHAENCHLWGPKHYACLLAAYEAEKERADAMQRDRAALSDKLHGTPCAEIRWQEERDALRAEVSEIEAGRAVTEKHEVELIAERDALSARVAVLEGALGPFACKCHPDCCSAHGDGENPGCWMGRARDVLSRKEGQGAGAAG